MVLPIPRLCIVRTRFWDAVEERPSLLSEEVVIVCRALMLVFRPTRQRWKGKRELGSERPFRLVRGCIAHEPLRQIASWLRPRDDFPRLTQNDHPQADIAATDSASSDWESAFAAVAAFLSTNQRDSTAYSQFRIPLRHAGYFVSYIGVVCL
jgi:hypothetical protein